MRGDSQELLFPKTLTDKDEKRMIIDTIVTDMDGTLLAPGPKISDYTMRVMNECKRRGIRIIPASGRTRSSVRPYVEQLDTGMPYISCNGAEIVSADHQMLHQAVLDLELQREIVEYMQNAGFYIQVYRDDCFYYAAECRHSQNYKKSSGMTGIAVGDLLSFLHFPTPKILTINDPDEVQRMLPIVSEKFADRVEFTISEANFLEAEPVGACKGNALRRLAEMRGDIVPERTLTFGDSLNDMSLLAYTPNSVAMGNAREELKQAAAYVCRPTTEDGLARFVEEHVLAHMA